MFSGCPFGRPFIIRRLSVCQDLLASCLIYPRALLEYVIFIVSVRSVNKMLQSMKFAEDKVLTFLILREKCQNSATLSLTQILTLISRAD